MNYVFSPPPQLLKAKRLYEQGRIWLSLQEASALLKCDQGGLLHAARARGTLGTLEFCWVGPFLKISTMSVIRFLAGGYPLADAFKSEIAAEAPDPDLTESLPGSSDPDSGPQPPVPVRNPSEVNPVGKENPR